MVKETKFDDEGVPLMRSDPQKEKIQTFFRLKDMLDSLENPILSPNMVPLSDAYRLVSETLDFVSKCIVEMRLRSPPRIANLKSVEPSKEDSAMGLNDPMIKVKYPTNRILNPEIWEDFNNQLRRVVRLAISESFKTSEEDPTRKISAFGDIIKLMFCFNNKIKTPRILEFMNSMQRRINSLFATVKIPIKTKGKRTIGPPKPNEVEILKLQLTRLQKKSKKKSSQAKSSKSNKRSSRKGNKGQRRNQK